MENSQIPDSNISPRSKKIRKTSKEPTETSKKHFTTNNERRAFINDLLKRLTLHLQKRGELQKDEILFIDDLKKIQAKNLDSYDECLVKVLEKHGESSAGLRMDQWRKKVTGWIKNLDKPDQRGGRLIPQPYDEVFQQRVLGILSTMKIRSYDESTRKRFIEAAQDLRLEGHLEEEKNNTFSDNWWFGYLKKHPDVKKVWKAIPLERTFEKRQREIQSLIAKDFDYFFEELIKSGNIRFYYQDLILNPMVDQIPGLHY